jgi:hypothetical protein
MRMAYQEQGVGGLLDQRRGQPAERRVPCEIVEKVLCPSMTKYFDFNVKHCHAQLVEKHGIPYS